MPLWTRLGTSTLALCALASAGWSLTAEEAWNTWKTAAASSGQSLTAASEAKSGNVLTLSGVAIDITMEEGTVKAALGEVALTENGDGSVTVTVSETYNVDVAIDPQYGETVEATLAVSQPGLSLTASDAGGGVTYAYNAPSLTATIEDFIVDGEAEDFDMTITVSDWVGSYGIGAGDTPTFTSTYAASNLTVEMASEDPDVEGDFDMSISMANLGGGSNGTGGGFMNMQDLPAMIEQGLTTQMTFTYGSTEFDLDFSERDEEISANGTLQGGSVLFALDPDKMNYQVTSNGLNVAASGTELPGPEVSMSMGTNSFTLLMPVAQTEEPKPFVLATEFRDLELADIIWNMFDPGAVLPREPATLTLNLSGMANWVVDIFDPAAMAGADLPAELHSLSITDVLLSVAGASLTADGSFTFDNADLETFGGFPAPTGALNLTLEGGNGLLDRLVTMGLVPEDQANMVKFMSGTFLRPGDGPDTLVSEIGVSNGTLTANGNPIPF